MINNVYNFCKPRVINLAQIPVVTIPKALFCLGQTVSGVFASALSMVTFGQIAQINDYANTYTYAVGKLLPTVYSSLLSVINPKFEEDLEEEGFEENFAQNFKEEIEDDSSFLANKIVLPLVQYALLQASDETSFCRRHVISRLAFAALLPIALLARTLDLAMGIPLIVASLLTLGTKEKINTWAIRQLRGLNLLGDICLSLRGLVHPGCLTNVKVNVASNYPMVQN